MHFNSCTWQVLMQSVEFQLVCLCCNFIKWIVVVRRLFFIFMFFVSSSLLSSSYLLLFFFRLCFERGEKKKIVKFYDSTEWTTEKWTTGHQNHTGSHHSKQFMNLFVASLFSTLTICTILWQKGEPALFVMCCVLHNNQYIVFK